MCLVAAVVMATVGTFMLRDLSLLERRGEVVTGTVLALNEPLKGPVSITVRYVTLAGQTIVNDTSNYYEAEVGKTIEVVYDREDPYRMQAADWGTDLWIPGGIFFGLALFFLVVSTVILWPRRAS